MKIGVVRTDLLECIREVAGLAAKKNGTLEILNHCHCKLVPNDMGGSPWLEILGTNLEVFIQNKVPCTILEDDAGGENSFTLPTGIVMDLVQGMSDTNLLIWNEPNNTVHINSELSSYTILSLDPGDYPQIPKVDETGMIDLESSLFSAGLRSVAIAMGEATKPVLCGVYVSVDANNQMLGMVATDTHRLAYKGIQFEDCGGTNWNVIIPRRTVQELLRILPDADIMVNIAKADSVIYFRWNDKVLAAMTINGQYPDWRKVIPEARSQVANIRCDVHCLAAALRRVTIVAREDANRTIFVLDQDNLTMKMNAESGSLGTGNEAIELFDAEVRPDGEFITDTGIRINSRFIADALGVLVTEEVEINYHGELSPVKITGEGDDSYLYIVMPLAK